MMSKIFICPSDKKYGCSWEGSSEDILDHFIQEHEDILYYTNFININLDVTSENFLLFVDTEIYLLQSKLIESELCLFLRYLGPAKIAANFSFDIHLVYDGNKIDRNNIKTKNGFFSISLESLQSTCEDIKTIGCQLLISGSDLLTSSSDDGVFLEDASSPENEKQMGKRASRKYSAPRSEANVSIEENVGVETTSTFSDILDGASKKYSVPKSEANVSIEENVGVRSTSNFSNVLDGTTKKYSVPRSEANVSIEENVGVEPASDFSGASDTVHTTTKEEPICSEGQKNILKTIEVKLCDTLNFLFGEPDSPKANQASLQRSQTFSTDDLKRRNQPKRNPSMRSLGSIKESDLEFELKCFNCNSHLIPPIFLCEFHHNICANCFQNCEFCSACNLKITPDRNVELEEKSMEHLFHCKNQRNGCPQQLSYQDILDHEINCTFCFYICPIIECGYKGPYQSMLSHLKLIHSSIKMLDSFTAVFQKHTELFLVHEKMGFFYCTLNVLEDRVMWKAQFCGPKERKFFCELKFKGKTFKYPLLLVRDNNNYFKEISIAELKEQKVKSKNSILTITR